jgi:UDP-glucuronate 4-epimerase
MAIHKFVKLIDKQEPIPMFGDGSIERDYTYIDDIVDGVVRAIDKSFGFEIFNLGEHHTTTLRDLVEIISRELGKEAKIDHRPPQPGDMTIAFADIRKTKAMLGYNPETSIEKGIREFVRWYRTTLNFEGSN